MLITGVSDDSIAGELALQLSTTDPKLLILGARAESRVSGIRERIKSTKPDVETRFLNLDLSDLSAVRDAVGDLKDVSHIDHLVCVAGVMFPPYSKTKDGFESQLGVNYLANFLLVKLLLPKIRAAGPDSSVVIMASSMVRQGKMHFDDFNFSVSLIRFGVLLNGADIPLPCRMAKHTTLWSHMVSRTLRGLCLSRDWVRS